MRCEGEQFKIVTPGFILARDNFLSPHFKHLSLLSHAADTHARSGTSFDRIFTTLRHMRLAKWARINTSATRGSVFDVRLLGVDPVLHRAFASPARRRASDADCVQRSLA